MLTTAIIGGTGVYDPGLLDDVKEIIEETPYGSATITIGKYQNYEIAFIPRHGGKHSIPPHLINYRANIMALHQLGVKNILATAAVGSLDMHIKPGQLVLADQFLDFTRNRKSTFYEGGQVGVVHCDMTVPYCPRLREALQKSGSDYNIQVTNGAVYVCTEGPRFETAAEINMYRLLGGQIVGMTSVPEVCLARELGMCYGNISIVTNYAAGISSGILTHSEVVAMMKNSIKDVKKILINSLQYINDNEEENLCDCRKILNEPGVIK